MRIFRLTGRHAVAAFVAFATVVLPMPIAVRADDASVRGETRTPGAFRRVAIGGPFDVEIRQGSRDAVTIRADDATRGLVETTLEGSGSNASLSVKLRDGTQARGVHAALVVEMVRVDAITFGGSGRLVAHGIRGGKLDITSGGAARIEAAGLEVDDLAVTLGGSGHLQLAGRAPMLRMTIAGSGVCDADQLAAKNATLTVAGSGDVHLRADDTLSVTIAGSGNVVYRGDPKVSTTVLGTGSVRKG